MAESGPIPAGPGTADFEALDEEGAPVFTSIVGKGRPVMDPVDRERLGMLAAGMCILLSAPARIPPRVKEPA